MKQHTKFQVSRIYQEGEIVMSEWINRYVSVVRILYRWENQRLTSPPLHQHSYNYTPASSPFLLRPLLPHPQPWDRWHAAFQRWRPHKSSRKLQAFPCHRLPLRLSRRRHAWIPENETDVWNVHLSFRNSQKLQLFWREAHNLQIINKIGIENLAAGIFFIILTPYIFFTPIGHPRLKPLIRSKESPVIRPPISTILPALTDKSVIESHDGRDLACDCKL